MAASTTALLSQMARYHGWATERLLASVATVPQELYRQSCGLFFGSIHGTLNHLLLTDRGLWYPRFSGTPPTNLPLDAEMESDRKTLASELIASTTRWADYVGGLDEVALSVDLRYTMTTGQERALPMPAALLHVFNHGTHHRGQITAAISAMGLEYPPLDLPFLVFSEVDP